MTHYEAIEKAILYLHAHADEQPSLAVVAQNIGLSPHHFQRIFQEWAGVSPKKFVQFVTLMQAKQLLRENKSLMSVTNNVGLSSTSRLHDLFVTIEGMTPAEYKNGGQGLTINYSFSDTSFGRIMIASTAKGVCYLAFCATDKEGEESLRKLFPKALLRSEHDSYQQAVLDFFNGLTSRKAIKLHLKGTPFQLKVWHALLQIPEGNFSTYSRLAQKVGMPRAARAVGNAVGANPVAYIIPCHRVLRETGALGGYHWGTGRKQAMIFYENVPRTPD